MPEASVEIVVRADDDPHDLAKPRGKQDWQLDAALHLVPAHDRHLADGLAGSGPGDVDRARSAGRRTSSAGRSALEADVGGRAARRPAAARAPRLPGRPMLADDTYAGRRRRGPPPHRAVRSRHRRLPQRSCSGVPQSPTLIEAALQLARRRRRRRRRGAQLHRPAVDRRAGRPVRPERPAATRCGWCSTRATGRRAG